MTHAFICDAIRTPFGRYGGALSSVRTDDRPVYRKKCQVQPSTACAAPAWMRWAQRPAPSKAARRN